MRRMTTDETIAFLSHATRTGKIAWVGDDGAPHVTPIWFVVDRHGDGFDLVFNTGADTPKARAMRRDQRVALVVDDEAPPFALVRIAGTVELGDDLDEVRRWATVIGARYMGADRGEEFGARNGVPGELVCRLRPTHVSAFSGVAD